MVVCLIMLLTIVWNLLFSLRIQINNLGLISLNLNLNLIPIGFGLIILTAPHLFTVLLSFLLRYETTVPFESVHPFLGSCDYVARW